MWAVCVCLWERRWLECQACHNRNVHLSPRTDLPEDLSKSSCFSLDLVLKAKIIGPFHDVLNLEKMKVLRKYVIQFLDSQYIHYVAVYLSSKLYTEFK